MMASKVAYENAAYIKEAVTDHWKMHFVGFYSCWNKFLNNNTTQAFHLHRQGRGRQVDRFGVPWHGTLQCQGLDHRHRPLLSIHGQARLCSYRISQGSRLQDETDYQKGFPKELDVKPDQPSHTTRSEKN
uniref:Uncharacterized protein n=1 Tax=Ananas comosus var. bracteatus TaxID=296719 RepID=A0A6V7P515_ANACO|nr:unnamed protein product [Ananas comosus var. bracteatus]